jgi:DNA-binding GntR family transcriptional regulator
MTTLQPVPTVDRSPPPVQQIAEYYRREIRTGTRSVGDELPANRKMAEEWKVSTATALRAVALLREEGIVETRPGKAPIVVAVPHE